MQTNRIQARMPARFEVGGWKADGEVRNLGPGGLFVSTPTLPERGEKVWLELGLPRGGRVRATGLVWWTTLDQGSRGAGRGPGFGVRLVWSSTSFETVFDRLVEAHAQAFPAQGR